MPGQTIRRPTFGSDELQDQVTELQSENARLAAALEQASNRLVTLGDEPVTASTWVDEYFSQ